MAVQYTNRKRITYYLHEDNTKTGDLRYFFSTKNEGNLVDTLPEGFSLAEAIDFTVSFTPVLRFTLENIEKRSFIAKRFCLPGAVYEWRYIAGPDSLENLASEYVEYLGTESFYALW